MSQEEGSESKGSWIKTAGVVVVGLLALILAKGIGAVLGRTTVQRFSSGYSESAKQSALEQGIKKAAEQIRSQAPIRVDEITTLRDAMAVGNEIVYIMELKADWSASQIAAAQKALEAQNAKNICDNAETRKLVDLGGVMTWQYRVESGDMFKVSVRECA